MFHTLWLRLYLSKLGKSWEENRQSARCIQCCTEKKLVTLHRDTGQDEAAQDDTVSAESDQSKNRWHGLLLSCYSTTSCCVLATGEIRKRVEVAASLSGASELDMNDPQRRHYNVLWVGPLSITWPWYCLERERSICGIRQALFSCTDIL